MLIGDNELNQTYYDWYSHPEYNYGDNAAFYQHMPVLRHMCRNKEVLELGARYGTSTLAILAARPKRFVSIDIERRPTIAVLEELAAQENIPFAFFEVNDLAWGNDPANPFYAEGFDITFIDTLHTYAQLKSELELFCDCTREYIVMHDLVSFGRTNEDNAQGKQGLIPAIEEFLAANTEWVVDSYWFNCNGLIILRRNGT